MRDKSGFFDLGRLWIEVSHPFAKVRRMGHGGELARQEFVERPINRAKIEGAFPQGLNRPRKKGLVSVRIPAKSSLIG